MDMAGKIKGAMCSKGRGKDLVAMTKESDA